MKKVLGLSLLLVAYGLLWPGITQPVLSITSTIDRADIAKIGKDILADNPQTPAVVIPVAEYLLDHMEIAGKEQVYQRTRSILKAIQELYGNGFGVVAFLIGLFSIVIPVAKGLMLAISCLPIPTVSIFLRRVADLVSRWSMADVFVVGVFVAFLAANAMRGEGGMLHFEATLGTGFYCFLGYCLLSLVSGQILTTSNPGQMQRQPGLQ